MNGLYHQGEEGKVKHYYIHESKKRWAKVTLQVPMKDPTLRGLSFKRVSYQEYRRFHAKKTL